MNIKTWDDVSVGVIVAVDANEENATVILLEEGIRVVVRLPDKYSDDCVPGKKCVFVYTNDKYEFADAEDNVRLLNE